VVSAGAGGCLLSCGRGLGTNSQIACSEWWISTPKEGMAQSLATAGGHVRFDRQQEWRSSTVMAVVSTTVTADPTRTR